ncbi:hypothetical protein JNJ66_00840, partial [Candidatus Saccharibacteria bacterium]|nr:hypothetical protein [Candidatus Saccharibacteria bacterium]
MTSTGLNSPYANYSPTVDDNGTVVIISTADDPASWPTDRYLVVRKFDSTTGSATVLYKSSDD